MVQARGKTTRSGPFKIITRSRRDNRGVHSPKHVSCTRRDIYTASNTTMKKTAKNERVPSGQRRKTLPDHEPTKQSTGTSPHSLKQEDGQSLCHPHAPLRWTRTQRQTLARDASCKPASGLADDLPRTSIMRDRPAGTRRSGQRAKKGGGRHHSRHAPGRRCKQDAATPPPPSAEPSDARPSYPRRHGGRPRRRGWRGGAAAQGPEPRPRTPTAHTATQNTNTTHTCFTSF